VRAGSAGQALPGKFRRQALPGGLAAAHILLPVTQAPPGGTGQQARAGHQRTLRLGPLEVPAGAAALMAVINRTPDSFFDHGATYEFGVALDAASQAVADGAGIIDIGGVKAGEGDDVDAVEEIRRVAGLVAAVR